MSTFGKFRLNASDIDGTTITFDSQGRIQAIGGTVDVQTITGNDGQVINAVAGDIQIIGSTTQGLSFSKTAAGQSTGTIADATTTQKGVGETATNAEAVAAASSAVFITPSNLPSVFAAPPAIGGTTPSSGSFTTLSSSTSASLSGTLSYDGIAAGYTGSQEQTRQTGVQTTDATVTDLVSIALSEGEMIVLEARVGGFQSDFSDGIGSWVYVAARRATGGNVTLIGIPVVDILESDATTDVTVTADTVGQNLKIQVTGVAAQTWNWVSTHKYHKVLTNA